MTNEVSNLIARIGNWFVSALFFWGAWSILAPHLNAPEFGYWEIFVIRMALSNLCAILWQRSQIVKKED